MKEKNSDDSSVEIINNTDEKLNINYFCFVKDYYLGKSHH